MIRNILHPEEDESRGTHPQDILNIFRERYQESGIETLTTRDIADELGLNIRTVQIYVRELADEGRLVLETEGKPNHWRLSPTEPREPVYSHEVAKARRISNKAADFGSSAILWAIAVLAAAGFIISYHVFARSMNVQIPPLTDPGMANTAVLVGVVGSSFLFLVAFVSHAVAIMLPRYVEHQVDDPLPDDLNS